MTMDPVIDLALRGAFAVLFAFSAMEKMRHRELFFTDLSNFRLMPHLLVPVAGSVVIVAEVVVTTLLLSYAPRWGVVAGCALLIVYTLAILINLLRGRIWMECGCLGSRGEGLSYWLVARNLLLAILLAMVMILPAGERALLWLDYVSVGFSVFAAGVAYMTFNTLLAARARSRIGWGAA